MINPTAFFKAKTAKDTFLAGHPKFPAFLREVGKKGLREGSSLHVCVTLPDGITIETAVTLTAQDASSLAALMDTLRL